MADKIKLYRTLLAQHGYKWTRPRQQVLEVLLENSDKHISAEELHQMLGEHSATGLATVYRTLDLLTEVGIVQRLMFGDGCNRYELAGDAHHHHHLVCDRCGGVWEVPLDLLDNLERLIEKKHKFLIKGHHLQFNGLCAKCRTHNTQEEE